MIEDWSTITATALIEFWEGFLNFIPRLLGMIIVLFIGWFIASWLGKLIADILKRLSFDKVFERTQWQSALEKAEFKVSVSEFIGELVKWVLVIVFLLAAVEILGTSQFAVLLHKIIAWLPNLIVAVAIFVIAVIIADFAKKIIQVLIEKANVGCAQLISSLAQWAIWVFAIFAILMQLGIARELIQILFTGLIALLVIVLGISFGLGGKDLARDILEEVRHKIRK
jgi:hypothetical protein